MRKQMILIFLLYVVFQRAPAVANAEVLIEKGDRISIGSYPQTRLETVDGLVENENYEYADFYSMGKDPSSYLDEDSLMIISTTPRAYKLEPIDFEVISVENNKVTAISQKILEAGEYNSDCTVTAWNNSSLNRYLNGAFKSKAFGPGEYEYIGAVRIASEDEYNSLEFTKQASVTDYLETKKGNFNYALNFTEDKYDIWWLSSDRASKEIPFVKADGTLCEAGTYVDASFVGIRPVIEFNLTDVQSVYDDGRLQFRPIRVSGNDVFIYPTATYKDTALCAALYNNGRFMDAKFSSVSTQEGNAITLSDFYDFKNAEGVVKVIWFENLKSMKPLSNCITIDNVNSGINRIVSVAYKDGIVSIRGNIDLDALSVEASSKASSPWYPIEVSLQVFDMEDNMVCMDQVTAEDNGDYIFEINMKAYAGKTLRARINNTYNVMKRSYIDVQ